MKFRLYKIDETTIKDSWGFDVSVRKLVDTTEVEKVGTRPYNNGYEIVDITVVSDGINTYFRPIEVDYFSSGRWVRDSDHSQWYRAESLPKRARYIDAAGNPFTIEKLIEAYGK